MGAGLSRPEKGNKMGTGHDWTQADIETLRTMVASGKKYRDIVAALDGRHSHSAAIGKSARMGLARRKTRSPNGIRKKQPRIPTSGQRRSIRGVKRPPLILVGVALVPPAKRIGVLDLTPDMCRWPEGTPGCDDFWFCGAERIDNGAYCGVHKKIAYQRPLLPPKQEYRYGKIH